MKKENKPRKLGAWQLALRVIRNARIQRVGQYLDRLDELIWKAKEGVKVEKTELEALKIALDSLGARKEEKPERLDKLKEKEKKKKSASQVSSTALEKKMDKEADEVLGKWRKKT